MTFRTRWPLVLLLALLAGMAAFALLAPRRSVPAEGSREVTFVRGMIQHHAQAVDMATRIRERSSDRTLRSLALDIMLSQQEQIGQMRGWLTVWHRPWAGAGMDAEHARMMGMAAPAEVATLDTQPVKTAEVTFLRLMRRHHQGALAMVRPVLDRPARPEVQALARQIGATQSAEIRVMDQLLARRDASSPSSVPEAGGMPGMDMGGPHSPP